MLLEFLLKGMLSQLSLVEAVISLSAVTLAAVWGWAQWRYRRQIAFARTLPTALPAFPVVGHLPYMAPTFKLTHPMITLFLGRHHRGVSCIWMGHIPWFVLNRPEDIRVILNNSHTLGKSEQYEIPHEYIGKGLITSPVSLWKKSRKQINPIFSLHNFRRLTPSLNDSARHFVQDLDKFVGTASLDVEHYVYGFSLMNVLKILFGPDLQIDRKSEEFTILLEGARTFAPAMAQRAINPLLIPDVMFRILKGRDWKILRNMQKHVKKLYHRSLKTREKSQFEFEEGRTILEVASVLKEDSDFGEDYIDKEIITLVVAGTDTNAITISSCLLALGTHHEIQDNLYNEIISVVGEDSRCVELEDISKMRYLDQVLKETLRRFILVPVVGRRCDEDVQLKDCTIPKGSTVMLALGGLDLDPEVFPDPLRFDPDRFSPENVAKRDSHCFLPFSGGPRGCIGKTFAMIVMKIALVHLLRSYEIRSDVDFDDLRFTFGLALTSTTGYHISVKRRAK